MTQPNRPRLVPSLLVTVALLAWALMPGDLASGTPLRVREALRNDLPSLADYERMERGYYEQLLDSGRQFGALGAGAGSEVDTRHHGAGPDAATTEDERLTHRVADVREFVLRPGLVRDVPHQIPWSTNAHGMRDRAYPTSKPPGTFRVGLAGDSIAAGWGVDDPEGFEPRLERLWDARSRAANGPAIEVLNFAVPGHGPGQRWSQFATVGWAFAPDLVIYEATPADAGWDERRLRGTLARGVGFDAPVYRAVLRAARVPRGLTAEGYRRVLRPLRWALLGGVYRAVVADCRAHGVPAVWVLIPRVGKPIDPAERIKLMDLARRSKFDVVIDATDAYAGADPKTLAVGPNDFHPNAEGHARIARVLDRALAPILSPRRLQARLGGPDHTEHARSEGNSPR